MPSRQDQLHSYQFMVQRVVAALVMRETDPAQSPFRRAAGATLASVLIAAIALGGVGLYGLFVGGGATKWRDTAAVIVEKESGARYVYRDEKLHLVLNYASALLIVGSAQPKTVLVSRKSIEGVPRGVPLGIADAPDSLPAADRLSAAPWTICSMLLPDGGSPAPRSVLLVGSDAAGGRPLGDAAVLARHPDDTLYLIWHGHRHLIEDGKLVLSALTWATHRPTPVAPALLNALPAGDDLARIPIPGRGRASAKVPDAKVGEVFEVRSQGGGQQYAVARRDGLQIITQLQANLLLSDPDSEQSDPTPMSQADFVDVPKLSEPSPDDAAPLPATTPDLVDAGDGALCGQIGDDTGVREIRFGATAPDVSGVPRTSAKSTHGGTLADHVLVPPGRGAVVEAVPAPGASGGTVSIVTDLGRQSPVSSTEVLAMLGYGKVKPLRLPASVVALVPPGRALDPEAAREPVGQD